MPGEPNKQYLRIDTTAQNVFKYIDNPAPAEVLMDSLNANIGDQFIRDGWMPTECIGIDTMIIFQVPTLVKHFKSYFVHGSEHSLAYGFGRISSLTIHEDPQWPGNYSQYKDLNFANINGVEYGTLVSVNYQETIVPSGLTLNQNYPNPFNPTTKIKFTIANVADALNASTTNVLLKVYDVLGNEITTLVDEHKPPGTYEIEFDASHLPSGIYFYSITSGKFHDVKKMILMK